MNLAYSCAGEGFGHATRLAVLGPLLENQHRLHYFIPKTVRTFVRARLPGRPLLYIPSFAFVKRAGRVRPLVSALAAIPDAVLFPFRVAALARRLARLGIEAVISDFDPYLAWAAYLRRIPVFQVNHPGIIQRVRAKGIRAWFGALGTRAMEGPWTERAHVSFYLGDVGPIIRPELLRRSRLDAGYILAYLKASDRPAILPVLDRLGLPYMLFPAEGADFDTALAGCSCVLSSAGHQIMSEALALGKPMLALPQRGQHEQEINATMLEATGRGRATNIANLERDLPAFISALDEYRSAPSILGFALEDSTNMVIERIARFLEKTVADKSLRGRLDGSGLAIFDRRAS